MRIKDICSGVTDGSHNPPQGLENSDYLMLSSKNVFDDKITFDSPRYLSQIDFEQESKRTRIKSGDVLLTIVGTVGRAAVVGENMPQFTLQRSVAVLHPNVEICDSRYLMYALQANRNHIESRAKGVAQKGIYLKEVADIELQIPLLSEQTHRVKVLDKIAFVIKFHQKQLQKLDELVKARFVEMFGGIHDSSLYPYVPVKELTHVISGGTPSRDVLEYWRDGTIPWVKTTELQNKIITEVDEHITSKGLAASSAKIVPPNTTLIAMYGQGKTRGMTGYLGISASTNQACACILPSPEINSVYIWKYFELSYDKLRNMAKGGNQPNLNGNMIKNFPVLVPPIKRQEEYVQFVNQVDKSKVAVQKSLDEAQLLFDSLMQQYFG